MDRTTLPTYPHLFETQPIRGTVYKARLSLRPHPRITPMTTTEIQEHERQESLDALEASGVPSVSSVSLRRERARLQKRPDHAGVVRVNTSPPTQKQMEKGKRKSSFFERTRAKFFQHRNGNIEEGLLAPTIDDSTSTSTTTSMSTMRLTTGFHSATYGCSSCKPPLPLPVPVPVITVHAPPPEPFIYYHGPMASTSFSSTSDSNTSSCAISDSSLPTIHIPILADGDTDAASVSSNQIDMDVFKDFDGCWAVESDEHPRRVDGGDGKECWSYLARILNEEFVGEEEEDCYERLDRTRSTDSGLNRDDVDDGEEGEDEASSPIGAPTSSLPSTPRTHRPSSAPTLPSTPLTITDEVPGQKWPFDLHIVERASTRASGRTQESKRTEEEGKEEEEEVEGVMMDGDEERVLGERFAID